jgi:hypothetical protein
MRGKKEERGIKINRGRYKEMGRGRREGLKEVLTAVVMKISIFLDITPCSPLKVNRSFEVTCRLHL